jgi:hypothetical protein
VLVYCGIYIIGLHPGEMRSCLPTRPKATTRRLLLPSYYHSSAHNNYNKNKNYNQNYNKNYKNYNKNYTPGMDSFFLKIVEYVCIVYIYQK